MHLVLFQNPADEADQLPQEDPGDADHKIDSDNGVVENHAADEHQGILKITVRNVRGMVCSAAHQVIEIQVQLMSEIQGQETVDGREQRRQKLEAAVCPAGIDFSHEYHDQCDHQYRHCDFNLHRKYHRFPPARSEAGG